MRKFPFFILIIFTLPSFSLGEASLSLTSHGGGSPARSQAALPKLPPSVDTKTYDAMDRALATASELRIIVRLDRPESQEAIAKALTGAGIAVVDLTSPKMILLRLRSREALDRLLEIAARPEVKLVAVESLIPRLPVEKMDEETQVAFGRVSAESPATFLLSFSQGNQRRARRGVREVIARLPPNTIELTQRGPLWFITSGNRNALLSVFNLAGVRRVQIVSEEEEK